MDSSSEIQTRLCHLENFMDEVLSSQRASRPHKLFFLIERWLRQFHLDSQIDSSEILVEAYMRTRSKILKGVNIERFPAWFNRVSFKIIQEYSKRKKYRDLLKQRLIRSGQHFTEDIAHQNDPEHPNIEALLKSLEELKEEELEILNLRIVQGLSWKDVRSYWCNTKGKDISESALRKKGERALSHLRDVFASTRPKISLQVGG